MRPSALFAGCLTAALLLAPRPAFALLCGVLPLDPMTVSASTLAFGNYTGASVVNASTTVTVSCGIPVELLPSFTIAISAGTSGNTGARYMNLSGQHLKYNLYTSTGYSQIWGDGNNGTVTRSFDGVLISIGNTSFTAYGQVETGQYLTPGTYTDTVTVTVTY